jgi:ParB family chromosome partitioning protein
MPRSKIARLTSDGDGKVKVATVKHDDSQQKVAGMEFEIDTSIIIPFPDQPRHKMRPEGIKRLARSIEKHGQRVAGEVCVYSGFEENFRYQLIDGERRFSACRLLNRPFKTTIRGIKDEGDHYRLSAVANFHRESHTPMEIAQVVSRFRVEYVMTWEEISDDLGMTPMTLRGYELLVHLHPDLQLLLEPETPRQEKLTISQGKMLAKLPADEQLVAYREIRNKTSDESWLHVKEAVHRKGITERQSRFGRKHQPKDDFRKLSSRLDRIVGDLGFLNKVPDDFLSKLIAYRSLEANTSLLELVRQGSNAIFELRRKIERNLPPAHQEKLPSSSGDDNGRNGGKRSTSQRKRTRVGV